MRARRSRPRVSAVLVAALLVPLGGCGTDRFNADASVASSAGTVTTGFGVVAATGAPTPSSNLRLGGAPSAGGSSAAATGGPRDVALECPETAQVESVTRSAPLMFLDAGSTCLYLTASSAHTPGAGYSVISSRPGDAYWRPAEARRASLAALEAAITDRPDLGAGAFAYKAPRQVGCGVLFPHGSGYLQVGYFPGTGKGDPVGCSKAMALAETLWPG